MIDLFKLLFTAGMVYLLFIALKDKFFKHLVVMTLAISLFGYGYIYCAYLGKKVEEKTEAINESFERVGKSIDKFGNAVDDVQNNSTVKGINKASNKINSIDKSIKDSIFKVREKITGTKVKREE